MTVSSQENRANYIAIAAQVNFDYTFACYNATHMLVYADGVLQTLNVDYTINLALKRVTFVAAPGAGVIVILLRIVPLMQLVDYVAHDAFPAETHERALDLLCMMAQQMNEMVDRVFKVPVTSLLTNIDVPVGAGYFLRWNAGADGIDLAAIGTGVILDVMTDEGDMIRAGAGPTPERVPVGTDGQVLRITGVTPDWEDFEHHTDHERGGVDEIKLDDLATPDDNADLNVTITEHGLCPISPDDATQVLKGGDPPAWAIEKVVQQVNIQTGAMATGTTAIPYDDTIPQKTEGDEYMTLAITPTSATNILVIDAFVNVYHTNSGYMATALFQDAGNDALACSFCGNGGTAIPMVLRHRMVAGTTIATIFKIRCGSDQGATTTFNGVNGARKYGGVTASSITITEMAP